MLDALRKLRRGDIWPPIDLELADLKAAGLLKGKVLNAGAGWRDISHLIDGELVNQDLSWEGDDRTDIHIFSPIHQIPVEDGAFDAVVCIAVLEHVANPGPCVAEMARVLKPGGALIASAPFLQPEHKVPGDYQRYTRDGLSQLMTDHGLDVVDSKSLFSVYHSLHWIAQEWLRLKQNLVYKLLRVVILMPLAFMARRSTLTVDTVASAFRVVALKPQPGLTPAPTT